MFIDKLPEDYLKRMKNSMEAHEYADFCTSYEEEPNKSLRLNTLKKCSGSKDIPDFRSMFSLEPVEWCDNGYYYNEAALPGKHPLHEAGAYYIQEASAMAPVQWLNVKPDLRILDLCAAPGGKSTEIAELMQNTGLLVANEPDRSRAKILSQNIERLGIRNALVTNETPERLSEVFEGFFDRILVDAPCSGEGMFKKNPEAISEWSTENVSMCACRQDRILENAARMLVPGGIMLYSTCTFSRDEDEGSIERFLNKEKDFCLLDPDSIKAVPAGFSLSEIDKTGDETGTAVRLWPHRLKGEGHFFAVLKRKGSSPEKGSRSGGKGILREAPASSKKLFKEFMEMCLVPGFSLPDGVILEFGDQLYHADPVMPGYEGLKVLRPGLHLGTIKNKRFEPGHALALFLSPCDAIVSAALPDMETAIRFLRGESLPSDLILNTEKKGWCIAGFMGMSLGWGKSDGRIIKNHYPKGLRIN